MDGATSPPVSVMSSVLAAIQRVTDGPHLDAASRAESARFLRELRTHYNACRACGGPVLQPHTLHAACAEETNR